MSVIRDRSQSGCGKAVFSHADARRKAKMARGRFSEKIAEYWCRACGGWHLGHRRDG